MIIMTGLLPTEMPSEAVSMNNCSGISGAHLLGDTVCLRGAGSRRGRLSHDASCSGSLPWTVNIQRSALFPLSFPSSQPASALASGREHIDPCPDFSGRTTILNSRQTLKQAKLLDIPNLMLLVTQ